MNVHEAALHHERAIIEAASSGRDNPFLRVGTRDEGSDDNGEPLCALPASREVHGDKWPTMPSVSPIATPIRLPRPIEDVLAANPHHIDTE